MSTFSLEDAKDHLADLLERAQSGEEVVIERDGRPVARLVPVPQPSDTQTDESDTGTQAGTNRWRPLGVWAGQVHIADDFDELPEEILAAFRGERP